MSLQPFPEFALDVAKSLYLSQRSKTELLVLSDLSSFRNCFGQSQHTQTVKRANRNAKQMHGSRNQARDLWLGRIITNHQSVPMHFKGTANFRFELRCDLFQLSILSLICTAQTKIYLHLLIKCFCLNVASKTNERLCSSNDDLRAALEVSLFIG